MYLGGLKMFREKKKLWKIFNVCWYQSYTQTFLSCFFIFTSFNTTPIILSWFEISSQWKVTNSEGLMLVCRWAGVNALVQNKFCSTIHLLSQYLLIQSHRWKHHMNMWNLLKVNNKETRLMSLTASWCLYR